MPFFLIFKNKTHDEQADVNDHMDYILSSLDMFAAIAENLIGYTFNVSLSSSGSVTPC